MVKCIFTANWNLYKMELIGREDEKQALLKYCSSSKSEFVAVYGRRRVGKTFLIKQYFNNEFTFYQTGLNNATLSEQLENFANAIKKYFKVKKLPTVNSWFEAIQVLISFLEKSTAKKKIIFLDELPWMETKNSRFLTAIEYFWNSWASARRDIVLIVCGSAASWITNKILNNKGGLHNRVTGRLKLNPFTLLETKHFLNAKGCTYNNFQCVQAYMVFGGIPFYLEQFDKKLSATQNINKLCFGGKAFFKNEYEQLFKSLFIKHERHIAVVEAMAKKNKGCSRQEILKHIKVADGGSLSRILLELEESNFIRKYPSYPKKSRESVYQLIDFYSLFHLKFLKHASSLDENYWLKTNNTSENLAWAGYAFEMVCLHHVPEIKKALGISGIQTNTFAWFDRKAQIDLVIDRSDQVINLIEVKYSATEFLITKKYEAQLRNKIGTFQEVSKSKKATWLIMLTTFGLKASPYNGLAQDTIDIEAFFK